MKQAIETGTSVTLWNLRGGADEGKARHIEAGIFVLRDLGYQDLVGGRAYTIHTIEDTPFVRAGDVIYFTPDGDVWLQIEVV